MITYFSTFITGLESIIRLALVSALKSVRIEEIHDGLVIYQTSSNIEEIKKVKFLNNSFIQLRKRDNLGDDPVKNLWKVILNDPNIERDIRLLVPRKNDRFRIRASIENQFVAIDRYLMPKIEGKIARAGRIRVDRSLPDIEFWFVVRREGFGLIGIRFTKRSNYEKTLKPGELYPELTYLMCILSDPNKNDVFLDPFSGSGAIPIQRAVSFPHKQIFASDNKPAFVRELKNRIARLNRKIVIGSWDATNLHTFKNDSVNKIVTDPPWGLHSGKNLDLPVFYRKMLNEFTRVLKIDGIMVILTAQKELLESELNSMSNKLELVGKWNTLVSGKKASIYKIRKLV